MRREQNFKPNQRNFNWPSLRKYIRNYVTFLRYNAKNQKFRTKKKLGQLRPFPPPERKWEEISMDFIFNLSTTKDNKKAILVVVDK